MDISKAIRLAVDTGKVRLGSRSAVRAALNGDAKLIIMARNCPQELREDIEHYCNLSNIKIYVYDGTSVELGSVCGKPFPVCALSVMEPGNSNLLEIVGK